MPKPVKGKPVKGERNDAERPPTSSGSRRRYSSTVREAQAADTRRRIVAAAAELFLAEGYARTTIKAIADRAEVAADTVYATFGAKIRVLTAVIDSRLAPAGEPNVTERPETVAIRTETDQRRQIALFADDITTVIQRVGPVFEILRTAAAIEPEAAAVYEEMNGYRLSNMRRFVEWIAANGPLRVGLDEAAETLWALASPDTARLLLEGRRWSPERYARWVEHLLAATLLPDDD